MYLNQKFLEAKPRDLKSTPGFESDPRVLENLINGNNLTTNEKNMWLIPFIKGQKHAIFVDFLGNVDISGISFFH